MVVIVREALMVDQVVVPMVEIRMVKKTVIPIIMILILILYLKELLDGVQMVHMVTLKMVKQLFRD